MGVLILLLVVGFFVIAIAAGISKGSAFRAKRAELEAVYKGWDIYVSPWGGGVVALNREGQKVVLGTTQAHKEYALSDVVSVEVIRDGASISLTNRGSQLAGAAIGGLALGGVGFIVGGLSGSKRSVRTVSSIELKIIVDDRGAPVHLVQFFKDAGDGTRADGALVRRFATKADHYHALLVAALRSLPAPPEKRQVGESVDQIAKLWELRQAGALTDEEFSAQKERLLAGDRPSRPPSNDDRLFDVILLGSAGGKLAAIRALRSFDPGLGLAEAKNIVERLPAPMRTGVSPAEAARIRSELESGGGWVDVRPTVLAQLSDNTGTTDATAATPWS